MKTSLILLDIMHINEMTVPHMQMKSIPWGTSKPMAGNSHSSVGLCWNFCTSALEELIGSASRAGSIPLSPYRPENKFHT